MTSRPSRSAATCTWAIEAAASGCSSKRLKTSSQRPAEAARDGGARLAAGERRHPVLQLGQFVGDIGRQQVAARGQRLAELHEDRPQFLQRQPQLHARDRRCGCAGTRSTATGRTGRAADGTGAWRAPGRRAGGAPARAGSRSAAPSPAASRSLPPACARARRAGRAARAARVDLAIAMLRPPAAGTSVRRSWASQSAALRDWSVQQRAALLPQALRAARHSRCAGIGPSSRPSSARHPDAAAAAVR